MPITKKRDLHTDTPSRSTTSCIASADAFGVALARMKNVFTVTGFGGNGITVSQIASKLGEAAGESRQGRPVRLRPTPRVAQGGMKESRRQ